MPRQIVINECDILGFEKKSDKISEDEYVFIKSDLDKIIGKQTSEQKLRNKIISLRYKMEDYLERNNPEEIVMVGQFIEEILNILSIKSKNFAEFIEVSKYDLSKIINGRKKLNHDLALKLGYTFNIKPDLWIGIQNKNELLMLDKENNKKYQKYNLSNLLTKK